MCRWASAFAAWQNQTQLGVAVAIILQRQAFQATAGEVVGDQVLRQKTETETTTEDVQRGAKMIHGPTLVGAEPADVALATAAGISDDHVQLLAQIALGKRQIAGK